MHSELSSEDSTKGVTEISTFPYYLS